MLAHKLIPPLIGVAALLLAASVALAVVLLTTGGSHDTPVYDPAGRARHPDGYDDAAADSDRHRHADP